MEGTKVVGVLCACCLRTCALSEHHVFVSTLDRAVNFTYNVTMLLSFEHLVDANLSARLTLLHISLRSGARTSFKLFETTRKNKVYHVYIVLDTSVYSSESTNILCDTSSSRSDKWCHIPSSSLHTLHMRSLFQHPIFTFPHRLTKHASTITS